MLLLPQPPPPPPHEPSFFFLLGGGCQTPPIAANAVAGSHLVPNSAVSHNSSRVPAPGSQQDARSRRLSNRLRTLSR